MKGDKMMVRPNRIWSPEHFHHVVSRGNWRANLFEEDLDFISFLNILDYSHRSTNLEIASYCLMSNHYHLLLRSQEVSLSKVMRKINKSYADYYNKKYEVSGHLFEERFFSKPIYELYGLLEVSRYIHMNPVEANIAAAPQNYRWSSFSYYYFPRKKYPPFINLTPITELFSGQNLNKQKQQYCSWMIKELEIENLASK
jgi:REP element-mobilizing transposase RayT